MFLHLFIWIIISEIRPAAQGHVSYLLCYNDTITRNISNYVQCDKACVSLDEACFCINNFSWTIEEDFLKTNLTCYDQACEQNLVVANAYSSADTCPNPTKSIVFNLTTWFEDENNTNFLQITPSNRIDVFTQITVVVLFPADSTYFTYDFGDGYVIQQSATICTHTYARSGNYKLMVTVTTVKFFSFTISKIIDVSIPLRNAILESCIPKYIVLSDNGTNFNCTGYVQGGTKMSVTVDFQEDPVASFNITSGTEFTVYTSPCLLNCSNFVKQSLLLESSGDLIMVGTFLLPNTVIKYDGIIGVIELFTKRKGETDFQVFRGHGLESRSYNLVQSVNISFEAGFNIIQIDMFVHQGDVVGFYLDDFDVLQAIHDPNSNVEYYISNQNQEQSLSMPHRIFENTTFQYRIGGISFSYFFFEFIFQYTGFHDVSFSVTDGYDRFVNSNQIKVMVTSDHPLIKAIDISSNFVVVGKAYNVCASIQLGAFSVILWSSRNATLIEYHDGVREPFLNHSHTPLDYASLTIQDCLRLVSKDNGDIILDIAIFVNDVVQVSHSVKYHAFPGVTGFNINYTTIENPPYQLQDITFFSFANPHPLNLSFIYELGDSTVKNGDSPLTFKHKYLKFGNYTITYSAYYEDVIKVKTIHLLVENAFNVVADSVSSVNDSIPFVLNSKIPLKANWKYIWDFGDGLKEEKIGDPKVFHSYSQGGMYTVQCNLLTIGVIQRNVTVKILEPVTDLKLHMSPTSRPFVNVSISLYVTSGTGNFLTYQWSNGKMDLLADKGSTATLRGYSEMTYEVSVYASNQKYSDLAQKSITLVSDFISMFDVLQSMTFVAVGDYVLFNISSYGGAQKSYEFLFTDNNEMKDTTEHSLMRQFDIPGRHQVYVNLKMEGKKKLCNKSSIVPCERILFVHVQQPIKQLVVQHFENNEMKAVNGSIRIIKKSDLLLRFIATDATNVKFDLRINETAIRTIDNSDDTSVDVPLSKVNFLTVDVFHCNLIAYNDVSKKTISFIVKTEAVIEELSITSSDFVEQFTNITFQAIIQAGSHPTYAWWLDSNILGTNENFTTSFSKNGVYKVNLRVSNPVSTSTVQKLITVIKPIYSFFIRCPNVVFETGEMIHLKYGFASGGYVTITTMINEKFDQTLIQNKSVTWNSFFDISFNRLGKYQLTITAKNPAGISMSHRCQLTVQDRVDSVTLELVPPDLAYVSENVSFSVTHYGGSDIVGQLKITTQNGLLIVGYSLTFSSCPFLPNCGTVVINHVFTIPDHYHITGSVYNSVSKINVTTQDILVVGNLKQDEALRYMELVAESTIHGNPTKIHVVKKDGFEIESCKMTFGDETAEISFDKSSPSLILHNYTQVGTYQIDLNCISMKGIIKLSTDVHVQQVIQIQNIVAPSECLKYGDGFHIDIHLQHVDMAFKIKTTVFLNGSIVMTYFKQLEATIYRFAISSDMIETSGTTNMRIRLSNYVSLVDPDLSVCIAKPIESLKCQTPIVWRYGMQTPFKITVQSETNVNITINYGDGQSFSQVVFGSIMSHLHQYNTIGSFNYTIYAINKVSTAVFIGHVDVLQVIGNASLHYKSLLHWPDNNVEMSVEFIDTLPKETVIELKAYFGDGTILDFMTLPNTGFPANTKIPLISHAYEKTGCFSIVVVLRSRVNSLILKGDVTIINTDQIVSKISSEYELAHRFSSFRDDYPLKIEIHNSIDGCYTYHWLVKNIEFGHQYCGATTKSVFTIDDMLHESGSFLITLNISAQSFTKTLISKRYILQKAIPDLFLVPSNTPNYQHKDFYVFTKVYPSTISMITFSFGDNGFKTVKAVFVKFTADELRSANLEFVSTDTVYILNVTHSYNQIGSFLVKVFAENNVSSSVAQKNIFITEIYCERPTLKIFSGANDTVTFHYQQHITIMSSTKVNCGNSKIVGFHWQVFKSSNWEMQNKVSSVGKSEVSLNTDVYQASLNVEKRSLLAGIYIVKLKAWLVDNYLDNTAEVYLIIEEDQIQALILGGSLQQLPWLEGFTLDASQSIDPNELSQNSLEFEWYCKMLTEPEPSDCFGNGLNTMEFFGSQWHFEKQALVEGVTYEFKLIVSNRAKLRQASTSQNVLLVDENIPIVNIRCKANCRELVNPSKRVSLIGLCKNCFTQNDMIFKWSAVSITFGQDTLTDESSQNLVIKGGGHLEGGKMYTIRLSVTKRSGVSAHAEYSIHTNAGPSGGQCSISPLYGIALSTAFTITCSNWVSMLGQLQYQIFVKSPVDDDSNEYSTTLVTYGPQESFEILLSSGKPDDNHAVHIVVKVMDLYEASTDVDINVKVYPYLEKKSQVAPVQNELLNLTTGKENEMEKLEGTGDRQGLIQLISSVTETLNIASGLDKPSDTIEKITNSSEENEANTMVQRQKMRNRMVGAITRMDVKSSNAVKQTADAIVPLLEVPDEITEDTQELVLNSFNHMTSFLETEEEVTEGEDPERVTDISSGLVTATGNVLQAILQETKPLPSNRTDNATSTSTDGQLEDGQQTKKENLTKTALNIVNKVIPLLLIGKVAGEKPTRISSKNIALEISRQASQNFAGEAIKTLQGGEFKLPKKLFDFGDNTVIIDSKMSTLKQNPFFWHPSSSGIKSPVCSLSFSSSDDNEIAINNLEEANRIELFVPQHTRVNKVLVNSSILLSNKIVVYKTTLTDLKGALVSFLNVIEGVTIEMLLRRKQRPTKRQYDYRMIFDGVNDSHAILPTWLNTSSYFVGLSLLNGSFPNETKFHLLELSLSITSCLFWNEMMEIWHDDGCEVGSLTTLNRTQCLCNHLTWFGSNFFILPNALNIEEEIMKLKNIDDYPALLATFCTICGIYLIAMVWARRRDRNENIKAEPIFLKSQSSCSGDMYHITVYTGHRSGSGSTATPSLIISGLTADTPILVLASDTRQVFLRGSVETFIFTTDVELEELQYLTIWHNDGGSDPGWFLSRIVVTNLKDGRQCIFFCNDWLAVDQSDGLISRVLPVASSKELTAFENIFLSRTARDLTDGHLWFSIISRPPRSHFTRAQRVSCCLCLLLSTMLSNAMFYRVLDGKAVDDEIDVSGFKVSWSKILIGIQSSLIVLPVNLILTLLFRRARPDVTEKNRKKAKYFSKAEKNIARKRLTNPFDSIIETESISLALPYSKKPTDHVSPLVSTKSLSGSSDTFQDNSLFNINAIAEGVSRQTVESIAYSSKSTEYKITNDNQVSHVLSQQSTVNDVRMSQLHLPDEVVYGPHWLKYVGWSLFVVTSGVAGFFTLLYGLSFGKVGQEEWLLSFFVSVFTDIIFNQPIKVVLFAAMITIVMRKLSDDYIQTEIENYKNLIWDREEDYGMNVSQNTNRPLPPSKSYIERTRKKRLYEAKLVDVMIEIVAYICYLLLCLLIAYGHRDPDAFHMTKNIENMFITDKFDQITSIPQFWNWSLDTLSPKLFDREWYNGKKIHRPGFLSDTATLLLGKVRIRQVRVRKEKCSVYGLFRVKEIDCGYAYSDDNEDKTQQYCTGWNVCAFGESALYPHVWRYRLIDDTGSYATTAFLGSYSGGGYIAEIGRTKGETDSTLNYLHKKGWLDELSRAVFVEFTAYNTHENFYVMVLMLMEIPATGGALVSKRIITTRLDRYSSKFSVFLGVCEVLFICLTLFYMVREFKKFHILKRKYFSDWRNLVEVAGFIMVWTTFALLIVRFGVVKVTKNYYRNNPNEFANFESAALADQVYGHSMAFLTMFVYIKFLKILRFNLKMSLMFKTIIYASHDIRYYSFCFIIVYMAFGMWSHLLFINSLREYCTFVASLQSLFNIVLGHFDFYNILDTDRVNGPLFFVTYVFVMTYILLNMFISIVNEAFYSIEKKMRHRKNKYDILDFLAQRLAGFLPASLTRKKLQIKGKSLKARVFGTIQGEPMETVVVSRACDENSDPTQLLLDHSKQPSQVPAEISNQHKVKKSKAHKNSIFALEEALDRIDAYLDHMIEEEEFGNRVLEMMQQMVEIKKNKKYRR